MLRWSGPCRNSFDGQTTSDLWRPLRRRRVGATPGDMGHSGNGVPRRRVPSLCAGRRPPGIRKSQTPALGSPHVRTTLRATTERSGKVHRTPSRPAAPRLRLPDTRRSAGMTMSGHKSTDVGGDPRAPGRPNSNWHYVSAEEAAHHLWTISAAHSRPTTWTTCQSLRSPESSPENPPRLSDLAEPSNTSIGLTRQAPAEVHDPHDRSDGSP